LVIFDAVKEDDMPIREQLLALLEDLGVRHTNSGPRLETRTPISGEIIGAVAAATPAAVAKSIENAHEAFLTWRTMPAPKRGELARLWGEELRARKAELGRLVSFEAGKTLSEGAGEVQEMIDMCDFAVGLSRQLYGLTIATERPEHRMMETWRPLGVVGIISAFNFPVAVWAWNAALALVCGNAIVWKPSEKTPLCALAAHAVLQTAIKRYGHAPAGLSSVLIGRRDIGEALVEHPKVVLVSATGSTTMGRDVNTRLARRFGRALLELGGNNAAIVCPSADQELALRAVAFAAMGTAGQRCTTLRRLFVHESVYETFVKRLKCAYQAVQVGNPLLPDTLVGPLIDGAAFETMQAALREAAAMGASISGGARVIMPDWPNAYYVRPALVEMPTHAGPMERETFAPVLYVLRYRELADAIALNNCVTQGLASSIFTRDMRETEIFLSETGSDCGIVNVNIGPSGAEIGGAFGGEKETGGGRESGSDAWKTYMRRATNTINYGATLPLAQGVRFDLPDAN
jgi:aldehyde dehydrogenase (NAD+)